MSNLFSPFALGKIELPNRIVMAPMTRARAPGDTPDQATALYYTQRASAGLIVTEGTPISAEGQGYVSNPGIFTDEQIAGWRLTTQSVHTVGGHIFTQLWHVGRVSHPSIRSDAESPVSGTSKLAEDSFAFGFDTSGKLGPLPATTPRQLNTDEVKRLVLDFADAAKNAINAGFDGVEIHAANGYLFEQFLNPLVNDRTDQYAADTIENRLRFTLEVTDAIIAKIGEEKVGIRLSPYGTLFDMPNYPDIADTYRTLLEKLGSRGLAYIHVMDQSAFENITGEKFETTTSKILELLREARPQLRKSAIILAGGMTKERADELIADGTIDLAAFGKPFIANPDLPRRLANNWPLAVPDTNTLYGGGMEGYVDYPPFRP